MPGFFEKHRAKIEYGAPSGCWLWAGPKFNTGYGRVWVGGKYRLAHREAYEAENGVGSADGLVVRHRCDTPACVNPNHLLIGTQADNLRDMVERGRNRYAVQNGSANGQSKLTEIDVRKILSSYVFGSRENGQRALARRFGVVQSVIGQIVNRESWRHIS